MRNEEGDFKSEARALEASREKLVQRSAELRRELDGQRNSCRERRTLARRLAAERESLEAELSANDEELSRAYAQRQNRSEALEHRLAERSTVHSRLQVLEDAIVRHEGVDEQVRGLLARAEAGEPALRHVRGIVADWITAPPDRAAAVEAALGPWAEALVVDDRESAIEVLRVLRSEGADRVRLLSLAELLRSRPQNGARPRILEGSDLAELSEELLPALLEKFDLLPPDVPLDLCSPRPGRALVGHGGEIMLNRYETVSGGRADQLGLVTRRTERDRLAHRLEAVDAEIVAARRELDELLTSIAQREQDREEKARRREAATREEREAQQSFRGTLERVKLLREEMVFDRREVAEMLERCRFLGREVERVLALAAERETERKALHEQRHAVVEERERLHEESKAVEGAVAEIDLEVARLLERRQAAARAQEALDHRILEREEECSHLEAHLEELASQDLGVREELASAAEELQSLGREREDLAGQLEEQNQQLEEFRGRTRELREEVGELRRQWEAAARKLQQAELEEHEQRLHLRGLEEKSVEDLAATPAELEQALADGSMVLSREMVRLRQQRLALEARLAGMAAPSVPSTEQGGEAGEDGALSEDGGESEEAEAPGSDLVTANAETDGTEADIAFDTDAESSTDDSEENENEDLGVEARVAPLDEDQSEAVEVMRATPLPDLKTEIDELRTSLQRIGPVNLDAIAELDEVEGRARFFTQQRDDLIEARKALRKMIEEIDRECEVRFEQTFHQVREHFRGLFRRLFRGGRADLVLQEDAADPSEAGVDVVAAPPGKEPRSIQMLSGGERTLTATALLFALFSTRPSPFCVLDEVDAALDESNTERFTEMVRDFLGQTQFVIVTHAKRTMAAADTLYGVTMEGDGVSRPIAMRFEEVAAESERAKGKGA